MSERDRSAFPLYSPSSGPEWGLTKREYYAAMAMQGALAGGAAREFTYESIALAAVAHADALLAELAKP